MRLTGKSGFIDRVNSGGDTAQIFKQALKEIRQHLRQSYDAGQSSSRIVDQYTRRVDLLIKHAWRMHVHDSGGRLTLVAVGGYGRRELHFWSDIDLLILFEKKLSGEHEQMIEHFIRFLWDIGLEVGHSARTIRECVKEAQKDLTVITNLMEARLLRGSRAIYEKMLEQISGDKIWPPQKFLQAKLKEQQIRYARFHDTPYKLEPNIKESPGGLRDIHLILWVAQRFSGVKSLRELMDSGLLTRNEYQQLLRGRNFLWRVRNGLHLHAGRREDRLLFDYQRALAKQMHYQDKPGQMAVEQLMHRYYRTAQQLSVLNEILLQHFEDQSRDEEGKKALPINRRFEIRNGYLDVTRPDVFSRYPTAILEIFLQLQQQPGIKGFRANAIRLLRASLNRIDGTFRANLANRSLFMEILRQPSGITRALRAMSRYGVLAAYIPSVYRITGQMQHDLFHIYTVDEHTLFVLRNIRRLNLPKFSTELPLASELMRDVVKPERLYLAALFHDVAKGRGGDHSVLGANDAYRFCKQHVLSEYDAKFVAWLVRYHLLMSWTAQRKDISDPHVVLEFAKQVGDLEHLKQLYILTVCDIRATNPVVWNTWKGKLLSQLYYASHKAIRQGFTTPPNVEERLDELAHELPEKLKKYRIPRQDKDKIWELVDNDYLLHYRADSIAWHTSVLSHAACIDLPLVKGRVRPDIATTEFLIFAANSEQMPLRIAHGFDNADLNIIDARVSRLRGQMLLITVIVLGSDGDIVHSEDELARLEQQLRRSLFTEPSSMSKRQMHISRAKRQFTIEPKVDIATNQEKNITVVEVVAHDRPGLLYEILLGFLECRVRLINAKIGTYGERVEDVFFITDRDGNGIVDEDHMECLKHTVRRRLELIN